MLFLFAISLGAQTYTNKESSRFSFTGYMTSTSLIRDTAAYNPGIFFGGGFVYTIVLSEHFNIGLEALYTGKAFRQEAPIIKYRHFYLDVPLYLQFKLGDNIRFNLGAQYSTFTNAKIIVIDQASQNGVNVKSSGSIKGADNSFLAGMELDLAEDLAITARYTISTSAFFEKNAVNFGVFQIGFNYAVFRSHKQFLNKDKNKE